MSGKVFLAGAAVIAAAAGGYWWIATPQATEAGIDRLRGELEATLGPAAKAVTLTPQGDHYTVVIDPTPVLAPRLAGTAAKASITPYTMRLTPEGKGVWHLEGDPQTVDLHLQTPQPQGFPPQSFDYRLEGMQVSGRFDESLRTMTEVDSKVLRIIMHQLDPQGAAGTVETTTTQGPMTSQTRAKQGATGLEVSGHMTVAAVEQTIVLPKPQRQGTAGTLAPAAVPQKIVIRMHAVQSDGTLTGLRWDEILTLLRKLVALRPDGQPVPNAARPEVVQMMRDVLPLFDGMTSTTAMTDLTIDAFGKRFALARVEAAVDSSGMTDRAHLREVVTLEGLSLPPELAADWALPIVPKQLRLDISAADLDLNAAAALVLDATRTGETTTTPAFNAKLAAALMPEGTIALALGPSHIEGEGYRFEAEAEKRIGPDTGVPQPFSAKLRLAGLDTLLTALQKAPEDVRQVAMALMMTRGFAKVEPDGALSWALATTPAGILTVNGTPLSGLKGMMP
ncbi:hypothetical protein C8J30_10424 [Rhodobacter viridis]|uniref:DUF945 domain-containing protein n=1 Tax=Rhodobacter viridis TaxID=1054202 RepID=A0A318U2L3_9RHOB|nr:hypothetical protein [Rhodobacter viridis]PYF10545.1 hypothetical protein C8J30_10424 [Rhodobacter viridis]